MNIPIRISKRLQEGIKKFKPIINQIEAADVNENDTVVVITDFLSEILGYDKYNEITSEYVIRKTYCDLAIKMDNKIQYLIEAKAVGITLKPTHIKQAVDYGANEGVDWVILTNSDHWKIYKMIFAKPIDYELIYEFTLSSLNPTKQSDLEILCYLTRESIAKKALSGYYEQRKALNKFYLGQALLTTDVINTIRRVLKKVSPDVKIEDESIIGVLKKEVIKRELLSEEPAKEAKKALRKSVKNKRDFS